MAEGNIRVTVRRGCQEPPESLARGTLSKGFSRNLGKPRSLLTVNVAEEVVGGRGQPETADDGLEESYEPIVPMKVGNRRATAVVAATGPTGGKG